MALLTIYTAFFGGIFAAYFNRYLGQRGISAFLIINIFFSLCIATYLLIHFFSTFEIWEYVVVTPWTSSTFLARGSWFSWFDLLCLLMIFTVLLVSLLVHVYSIFYMYLDPFFRKFMVYLTFFTFFMLFFVSASSFLQMFFGWEGVGIFSYLLINFWYTRPQANKSALKAILVNRIGDCGVMFAIILVMIYFGSADIHTVFVELPFISVNYVNLFGLFTFSTLDFICFLIFLGVMSKSAQLGLHTWLPDAMEGPTPVSALIHAATMVTAGIYLLIRTTPFFECAPGAVLFAAIVGGLTALFAASVALLQHDLKKIIAYSTCSQLGYMVMACATLQPFLAFFHLANHAYFKALLFLGAGVIIHCVGGEQDIRRMGGLRQVFPIAFAAMFIAAAALGGFPFLSGFYSKDVIIALLAIKGTHFGNALWLFSVSAAVFTSIYSFNLLFYVFLGKSRFCFWLYKSVHTSNFLANAPLLPLTVLSVLSGYFLKDILVGLGSVSGVTFLQSYSLELPVVHLVEFLPTTFKLVSLAAALVGLFYLTISEYRGIAPLTGQFVGPWEIFYFFFSRRWYWDRLYNFFIIWPFYRKSLNLVYTIFEKGTIEFLGPQLLVNSLGFLSKTIGQFLGGNLQNYVAWTICCFIVLTEMCAAGIIFS